MLSRQLGGGLAPLIAPSSRIRASLGHGICQRAPNAQSLRFRNSFGPKRRKHPVILAANGEGGPEGGDPSSPDEGPLENSLLFRLIIQYPAVRGTIAVALGYLAHVQPLGTLRWDPHAALIGLLFALPVAFVDAFIMLPSWEAPRTSRKMKVLVPQSLADKIAARKGPSSFSAVFRPSANPEAGSSAAIGAEAAPATTSTATAVAERPGDEMQSSSDASSAGVETVKDENPGMVEMERTVMVRGEQHPFRDALHRTQVDRAMNNVGRVLSPPAEALLLLLVHVSEEMLYRGVMLSFAIGWLTDRLYEAGADDTVSVLGGLQVPTSQMGAVLAASGMTITAVALLVQKELLPVRILRAIGRKDKESAAAKDAAQAPKEGSSNTNGDSTVPKASRPAEIPGMIFSDGKDSAMDMLERVRRSVESQQRWSAAVSALQEFVQWATLSSSFLVTGNLLAPIAGSVAVDAVFSVYQRKRAKEMIEARAAEALQFTSQLQDTRELAKAVASSRKERLRPSQDGDNNALDENIGMHVGESAQEEEGSANDNDESKREE